MNKILKCDFCGNPAATLLQHVVEGEQKTVRICGDCMRKNGIDLTIPETILRAFELCSNSPEIDRQLGEVCACGTTGEVISSGLAGCEKCYDQFRVLLEEVWKTEPPDSVPSGNCEDSLQAQLESAIDEERYEDAAVIRDKMQHIEEAEDVDEEEA